jgi:hypothetical protein
VALSTLYRYSLEALLADELMLAFHLSGSEVLGAYVRDKGPARYAQRMDWLVNHLTELRDAGLVRQDVDPAEAAGVLGVFAIGLVNAAAAIGSLSPERLRATVDTFSDMIAAGWETRPHAATAERSIRDAHLRLIDALDRQIAELENERARPGGGRT